MKRVILMVLVACGGGGAKTSNPTPPNAPGVIWETPKEPWHVLHASTAGHVDGNLATFGGAEGWVFRVDLNTGVTIHQRKLAMGTVTALVKLPDGRLLAVGLSSTELSAPPAAFTLDAELAPTPVTLPIRTVAKGSLTIPSAALAIDGVVITGAGLPLAIYDPKTWAVTTTLDNEIGWSKVSVRGEILLAERNRRIKRINLGTNGQRDLPYGVITHLASADGVDILRVTRDSRWIAELHREDKTVVPLPDAIDAVHPYDDKRFITTVGDHLRIHELPSGVVTKEIIVEQDKPYLAGITVAGKRAVSNWGGLVRVIDLETGTVTPKAAGSRQAHWLAIGNDGAVLSGNDPAVWTMSNGKPGASESTESTPLEVMRLDDPRHYVTAARGDREATLQVRTFGDKAVRTVTSNHFVSVWLARDQSLVLSVDDGNHKTIVRAKDKEPQLLFEHNYDADVMAVDPDGEVLLSLDGRVAVVGQDGKAKSTLRIPHCDPLYGAGVAEPGGRRAITYNNKDLALWDRETGKLLASIKSGSPEDAAFIPNRNEILLTFSDRVVLWSPMRGTRTLPWPGAIEPAISPDGKKLALSFFDGRIGVYDLDALLAAPIRADFLAGDPIPETCGEDDPLAVEASEEDEPPPSEAEDEDRWGGDDD